MLNRFFSLIVDQHKVDQTSKTDVTVVLNIWKRNYVLEQLNTLSSQTILPKSIWLIQCENHVSVRKVLRKYPHIQLFYSTQDLKYFGRYSLIAHVSTRYVWVLDDDVIPGTNWMENALRICEERNAIVCSNGRIIPENDYRPEAAKPFSLTQYVGDAHYPQQTNYCPVDTFVDYGCNSFFFKTEWIKHFWSIWPATFQTAEDMHLSATCKIQAAIPTIVPQQRTLQESGNIKPDYSRDEHASWTKEGFVEQRKGVLHYLIDEKGWKPLLW